MQPIKLTLEERERWAYAENDQRSLVQIYAAMGERAELLRARAEVAVRQQELGFSPNSVVLSRCYSSSTATSRGRHGDEERTHTPHAG